VKSVYLLKEGSNAYMQIKGRGAPNRENKKGDAPVTVKVFAVTQKGEARGGTVMGQPTSDGRRHMGLEGAVDRLLQNESTLGIEFRPDVKSRSYRGGSGSWYDSLWA